MVTIVEDRVAPSPDGQSTIGEAARRAVTYADVFDWPLTIDEVHRFLPVTAPRDKVRDAVADAALLGLERDGELVALAGRGALFGRRRRLAASSERAWPRALAAASLIGRLPFVRSVSISGSLAMGAAEPRADVDLFIVTAPGRLWLVRAATILTGHLVRLVGIRLCPNYLVTEAALGLPERDAFTAHELAQLVPVTGLATHRRLLAANAWYRDHLPNHRPSDAADRAPSAIRRWIEAALRTRALDRLERWEMRRKLIRLGSGVTSAEQRFDADTCKGHFEEHRRRALVRYRDRLAGLGLAP